MDVFLTSTRPDGPSSLPVLCLCPGSRQGGGGGRPTLLQAGSSRRQQPWWQQSEVSAALPTQHRASPRKDWVPAATGQGQGRRGGREGVSHPRRGVDVGATASVIALGSSSCSLSCLGARPRACPGARSTAVSHWAQAGTEVGSLV